MSAKVTGQVWDLVLTPAKQIVLLALADHASHDGSKVYPSLGLIAWKTGYSDRQVRRIMHDLENDGLLVRVGERQGKPTVYKIDLSNGVKKKPYTFAKHNPTPDKMSDPNPGQDVRPDKMSPRTSHGKQESPTPDIASLKTQTNHHQEEPSLKIKEQQLEPLPLFERPNAFAVYEQNIGMLTPIIADAIKDALKETPDWVEDAIREAALHGAKSWSYVNAVLKRWEKEGRLSARPNQKPAATPTAPEPLQRIPGKDPNIMLKELAAAGLSNPGWLPPELRIKAVKDE